MRGGHGAMVAQGGARAKGGMAQCAEGAIESMLG